MSLYFMKIRHKLLFCTYSLLARICSKHFEERFEYKWLQHKLLLYSPKNRRRISALCVPINGGPISVSSSTSEKSNKALTPDNSGHTAKRLVTKSSRNLFAVSREDAVRNIEIDVTPLWKEKSINCSCEEKYERKIKSLKEDFKRRNLMWANKLEKLKAQYKEALKKQRSPQNKLRKTSEDKEIVEAVRKLFTPGQLKKLSGKRQVRWTAEDVASAISLRSVSPKAYRYLRGKCNYPLPGLSTLRRWAATFQMHPGMQKRILMLMEHKGKSLSALEKLTVLSFDEMFIKNDICFDKNRQQVLGPHRTVQVIMARGLCSNWKQPVFYDFDQPVTKDLLNVIITNLHISGYIVVAIVSDMGSTNINLWNQFGININANSFKHPRDESKKIFVFSDVPHLLKLLRNHFLDNGYILSHNIISKDSIEQFLKISDPSDLKIGHKISQHMLDVRGSQRQKVSTAAKLLSETTANAIKYCGDNKLISDPNYRATSAFIKLVNDWFDI
jgi:hypothetical protein